MFDFMLAQSSCWTKIDTSSNVIWDAIVLMWRYCNAALPDVDVTFGNQQFLDIDAGMPLHCHDTDIDISAVGHWTFPNSTDVRQCTKRSLKSIMICRLFVAQLYSFWTNIGLS